MSTDLVPGQIADRASSWRLDLALPVIAAAQLMVVLDATIVNIALPHIQRALGLSGSGLGRVVNPFAAQIPQQLPRRQSCKHG